LLLAVVFGSCFWQLFLLLVFLFLVGAVVLVRFQIS
jgi:hypothetical protein